MSTDHVRLSHLSEDLTSRIASLKVDAGDVRASREIVKAALGDGKAYYGINTGLGVLAEERIGPDQLARLQKNLILSHSVGVGEPVPMDISRLITAYGANILDGAAKLLSIADVIAAMSLEALQGSIKPFDPRIQSARPHPGQNKVAGNVRSLLESSEILEDRRDCGKVQDPYCLRCVPQVHGASRDALEHSGKVVEIDINAATDNPLVFDDGTIISGGNFHGQSLAFALDYRKPLRPGRGVELAHEFVRSRVPHTEADHRFGDDLERCSEVINDGTLLSAVTDEIQLH